MPDHVILGFLVACGLRCAELAALAADALQIREGRWVLPDLHGKATECARSPCRAGSSHCRPPLASKMASSSGERVRAAACLEPGSAWTRSGWSCSPHRRPYLAPHDLRRTWAKLCRRTGGILKQIEFLLRHSSIQTTERYLSSEQEIALVWNDSIGL